MILLYASGCGMGLMHDILIIGEWGFETASLCCRTNPLGFAS